MLAVCLGLAVPAVADVTGETLLCYSFSKREVKSLLGIKKRIAYACISSFGEVAGATLTPGGYQSCAITGVVDFDNPTCADIVVCSTSHYLCL